MLYVFIACLIIAGIITVVRSLYVSIYFLVIVGTILWLYALFILGAKWQDQIIGISMVSIGVFLAHIWEEMFQDKEETKK
jgi:membrane protein implicated in regulation of membrane protease activity